MWQREFHTSDRTENRTNQAQRRILRGPILVAVCVVAAGALPFACTASREARVPQVGPILQPISPGAMEPFDLDRE